MSTKRHRLEGSEVNGHCRARVCCGGWSGVVRLYRPLTLDALEEKAFPGLAFFFSPSVVGARGEPCVLGEGSTPCDELVAQRPWRPCNSHGPFRCSCFLLDALARALLQLERELMLRPRRVGVVVDNAGRHEEAPFVHIDTAKNVATLYLCGLPLPHRQYGPFPLSVVDDEHSINMALATTFSNMSPTEDKNRACVLCIRDTDGACSVCRCVVCTECDVQCHVCKKRACKTCSVFSDEPPADEGFCCFNCYSL